MNDDTAAPLTKDEALRVNELHYTGTGMCHANLGPRGGVTIHVVRVRRNGATQTWKTRPMEWRMPVKYGMRSRDQFSITQTDAVNYHPAERCPANLR